MSNTVENKEMETMEVKEEATVNVPEVDEETKLALKPVDEPEKTDNEPEPEKIGFFGVVKNSCKVVGKGLWTFTKRSLPVAGGVILGVGGAMLWSYLSYNKDIQPETTEEDIIEGEGQYVEDGETEE